MKKILLFAGILAFLLACSQPQDIFALARDGRAKQVARLLKEGADPNQTDANGRTPLMHVNDEPTARGKRLWCGPEAPRSSGRCWKRGLTPMRGTRTKIRP